VSAPTIGNAARRPLTGPPRRVQPRDPRADDFDARRSIRVQATAGRLLARDVLALDQDLRRPQPRAHVGRIHRRPLEAAVLFGIERLVPETRYDSHAMPAGSSQSPELLEPGSVLDGRYRIVGVIGGGAMACVYGAEHLRLGRAMAIKVLHENLSQNRDAVRRFQREAATSGRFEHPNIVAVTDSGMLDDGRCYIVMEALEGETLGDCLTRERRLPWRSALVLAREILLGLRHAHSRGVVHRDIKPDNIFVLRQNHTPLVKILDFGIAKLFAGAADQSRITQQGLTVGSPAYMSPEQATGGEITPASDLYSFTVVLFEMLTGHTPFEGRDSLATLMAHAINPPPALHAVAPEIELPDGIEEIIRLGLAKTVADRIGTADRMLAMLDAIHGDAAIRSARPPTTPAESSPPTTATAIPARGREQRDEHTVPRRARAGTRWFIAGVAILALVIVVAYVVIWPAIKEPPSDRGAAMVDAAPPVVDASPPREVGVTSGPTSGSAARDRRSTRDNAKQWIEKGKTALAEGRLDEAKTSFERAIAADRRAHAAFGGLAEVSHDRSDFSGAIVAAKKAIALAPRNVAYRMTLAKAYYQLMRYDDAIQQWQKVLEVEPTNALAKKNIEMAKAAKAKPGR
jgi:eukaryotic-like serine/threonine-protein kinase